MHLVFLKNFLKLWKVKITRQVTLLKTSNSLYLTKSFICHSLQSGTAQDRRSESFENVHQGQQRWPRASHDPQHQMAGMRLGLLPSAHTAHHCCSSLHCADGETELRKTAVSGSVGQGPPTPILSNLGGSQLSSGCQKSTRWTYPSVFFPFLFSSLSREKRSFLIFKRCEHRSTPFLTCSGRR